jgi:hypothetical protein
MRNRLNWDYLLLVGMLFLSSQLFILTLCIPFGPGIHWVIFEVLAFFAALATAGIFWKDN